MGLRPVAAPWLDITQPLKDPLGRVPLLAVPPLIFDQPLVDDRSKSVQLRSLDDHRPAVARRDRKAQHLLNAVARDPKMLRRSPSTHAPRTGKAHLSIKFHGENPPALPVARKGKGGRFLRRPQQASPTATVADYCSADYTRARATRRNHARDGRSPDQVRMSQSQAP